MKLTKLILLMLFLILNQSCSWFEPTIVLKKSLPMPIKYFCNAKNSEEYPMKTNGFLIPDEKLVCSDFKGRTYCKLKLVDSLDEGAIGIYAYVPVGSGPNTMDRPSPNSSRSDLIIRSVREREIDTGKEYWVEGKREGGGELSPAFGTLEEDYSCTLRVQSLIQYTEEDYRYWEKVMEEADKKKAEKEANE